MAQKEVNMLEAAHRANDVNSRKRANDVLVNGEYRERRPHFIFRSQLRYLQPLQAFLSQV